MTGQPEAIVPAIAKAIQNYDVNTRPILKYFKLMRHDMPLLVRLYLSILASESKLSARCDVEGPCAPFVRRRE